MYRCETFRVNYQYEHILSEKVAEYLNQNNILRKDIIEIKTFAEDRWIYCMIIWEE